MNTILRLGSLVRIRPVNRGGESKQGGDRRRRDLFEAASNQGEEAPSCHTAAAGGEKTDIEQRERG